MGAMLSHGNLLEKKSSEAQITSKSNSEGEEREDAFFQGDGKGGKKPNLLS